MNDNTPPPTWLVARMEKTPGPQAWVERVAGEASEAFAGPPEVYDGAAPDAVSGIVIVDVDEPPK